MWRADGRDDATCRRGIGRSGDVTFDMMGNILKKLKERWFVRQVNPSRRWVAADVGKDSLRLTDLA